MATPFISGLVALLLQANPALTPAQAKAILKASSKVPNGTRGVHHLRWGFGRIDAASLTTVAPTSVASAGSAL